MAALTSAAPRHDPGDDRPPPLPYVHGPLRVRARGALWRLRYPLAALCLGAAAGTAVHALRPPPAVTVPVVVAARDVAAGTTLSPDDLVVARLPPAAAPAGAFGDPAEVRDRVAAVALPARLPLTSTLLADGALVGPPGTVVVAVRLDDPAVAALLHPGLHLDLVAAHLEGGPGETVARRAVVHPSPADAAPAGLLGATTPDDGPPVLVAVTPAEAVRVAETSVTSRLVAVVVP